MAKILLILMRVLLLELNALYASSSSSSWRRHAVRQHHHQAGRRPTTVADVERWPQAELGKPEMEAVVPPASAPLSPPKLEASTTSTSMLYRLENGEQVMFMSINDIDRQCPRGLNRSRVSDEQWQTAPFDDQCLKVFFQRMNVHLRRYYEWEEMLYTTLYFIISISALVGNGVVILAVIRKKEMRTNRNVLIVNLALSNLVLALTTIPFLWWPSIDFEFPYSKFFCKFANALPGSNIYCSTLTISVMAIDRYYSVKRMNVVQLERRQSLTTLLISLLIWVVSFLLSFPLLVYYDTTMLYVFKDVLVYDSSQNKAAENRTVTLRSYGWRQCRLSTGMDALEEERSSGTEMEPPGPRVDAKMIQLVMSLMQVLFLYVVPLIVLSIFNAKLTRFLQMNAKHFDRTRRDTIRRESYASHINGCGGNNNVAKPLTNGNTHNGHQRWSVSSTPATYPSSEPPSPAIPLIATFSATSSPSNHTNGCNNTLASPSERASERRRNRTTALLTAMACSYAVLWLPFTLVSMFIDLDILNIENGASTIERIDQACKLVSILSICVNPFLYGFLNTNFRNEFTDIFSTWIRYVHNFSHILWRRSETYSSIISAHSFRTNDKENMNFMSSRKSSKETSMAFSGENRHDDRSVDRSQSVVDRHQHKHNDTQSNDRHLSVPALL